MLAKSDRPLVIHPNSGEIYDASSKQWSDDGGVRLPLRHREQE